ncbi:unnamed protein product [Prunus armeniaca]
MSGTRYPITRYVTHSNFSEPHRFFVNNISQLVEPNTYEEARHNPHWVEAMNSEIAALEENHTWSFVPLPAGHRLIGCKLVFKLKYNSDGTLERYKARLVAKGFTQCEGIDYTKTFAPVAKLITVHCLLTVASVHNWPLHQMDVHNAFLHGDLYEEVYMLSPPGYQRQGSTLCVVFTNPYMVLNRRLEAGFYFLGVEIARSKSRISFCQRKYTLDILEDAGLLGAKPTKIPMQANVALMPTGSDPLKDPTCYRRLVGRLIYLTITRPEITYAVNTLSQFMHEPRMHHFEIAHWLLHYLK